jgi:hypothetical protein
VNATDLIALKAALDAVPLGHWIEVETDGELFRLVRVPGGWYLPTDVVIASADVLCWARTRTTMSKTMCRQCESGAEAAESADVLADDEREAWVQRQLADAPNLTPEQRARVARLLANSPAEATERATQALGDDR